MSKINNNEANRQATRLYLDLDGVMADFDAYFRAVFGLSHKGLADDIMWQHIDSHPSFFLDMPMMPGAREFFRSIVHLDPIILTACPRSNYANVAQQKRAWSRRYLDQGITVLPVIGGRNKPLFMHQAGDILIDDFERNTSAWSAAGGVAILHSDFETTRILLQQALAEANSPRVGMPRRAESLQM